MSTPTFAPPPGSFEGSVEIAIHTATDEAEIRYTTDGTAPTAASPLYAGPITVSSSATLRAIGRKPGRTDSAIASGSYDILAVLRVATTGDDLAGTGSAAAPFASIGRAAEVAATLTDNVEIWVAAGAYALAGTVVIPANTSMLGGYAAGDWSTRDAETHVVTVDSSAPTAQTSFNLSDGAVLVDGLNVLGNGATTGSNSCFVVSGSARVSNNSCAFTATGNFSGYGIQTSGTGSPTLEHNRVTITGGNNSSVAGIRVASRSATVAGNTVTVAYQGRYVYALHVTSGSSSARNLRIYNNVFDVTSPGSIVNGGNGVDIAALPADSELSLVNNTIRSGTQSNNGFLYSAIYLAAQPATVDATIANNIVFCRNAAATNNRAIRLASLPDQLSLWNNNLFGCATGILSVGADVYESGDLATVNGASYATGNLAFDLRDGANTYFVNESSDYRLNAGGTGDFLSVKTGAASGFSSLFTTDHNGALRTASSAIGWSMGAFEQDL